jgi:hypothetical protein
LAIPRAGRNRLVEDPKPSEEIDETELEEQEGEVLPDREEMSVVDLGEGGGMSPPPT